MHGNVYPNIILDLHINPLGIIKFGCITTNIIHQIIKIILNLLYSINKFQGDRKILTILIFYNAIVEFHSQSY